MATLSLNDISDALSQLFEKSITSQINTTAIGLNVMPVVNGGGKNAAWTVKLTARANAEGYLEGADMIAADFDSEAKVPASLNWGQYRKGAAVSGLAQATAATNNDPGSVSEGEDLFDGELIDANERVAMGCGTDLYSGVGSTAHPMIGLETAISAALVVYATIDPNTYPEWLSTVQSVAKTALSFAKIRAFLRAIYKASGKKPDLLLCDPDTFDAVGDLFGDNRPYTQEVSVGNGTVAGRRQITLEGGHNAIMFDGIPLVQDTLATVDTMWALNTKYIQIRQVPAYKSRMTGERFLDLMESIIGERLPDSALGEHMAGPGHLKPYVEMLGKTGDSDKASVKVYCQLVPKRRNVHGRLNLT